VVSETLQLNAAGACHFSYLLKAEPDGYSIALCRACAPHAPGPSHYLSSPDRVVPPSREPQRSIVMSVMGFIGGTFPHIYRGFYMTVN
jgi:hypothetical protein